MDAIEIAELITSIGAIIGAIAIWIKYRGEIKISDKNTMLEFVDRLEKRIDQQQARIATVEKKSDEQDVELDKLREQGRQKDARIAELEYSNKRKDLRIDELETEVADLRSRLEIFEKKRREQTKPLPPKE